MHSRQRPYVQFSKKIVVAVFIAVTIISMAGLTIDFVIGDAQQATNVIKVYIEYAMIVFAAYSGNSAIEKWILAKAKSQSEQEAEG